ncbi:MAG: hypothetical protein AAGC81_02335 [Pseudomonadota bacterium]
MFNKLEGDTCIVRHNGVYRPADLYVWDGKLFAKIGSGYVRLRANGTTTKDGTFLEHMEIEEPLFADKFGRLAVEPGSGRKEIARTDDGQLLIERKDSD